MDTTPVYPRRWWALAVLALCLLVISLDTTILNVALPTLARDLPATAGQLQWIVDAYVLAFAALLLPMGSLGDRFGRRRALAAGLLVLAAGSILAAWSGTPGRLVACRALMGAGGALIMPATLAITATIFPPHERGRAIGAWAAVSGLGVAGGPIVGGWLLSHFWWGAIFLVNPAVIALALATGAVLVPESRGPRPARLDLVGALLSIAGLVTLVYAIIEAPTRGWASPAILAAFAAATALLLAFVAFERRATEPMLDVRLFRNPRFSAASLAIALVYFALFGTIFLLTQYLQVARGTSALAAGVRLLPLAVSLTAAAPASARLVERFGARLTVAGGLATVAVGLTLGSTLTATSAYASVSAVLVLLGLGMGATVAPATASVMGAVPPTRAGVGAAVNDTTRQVGGALGVAVLGSLLSSAYRGEMTGAPGGLPAAASDSIGAAARVAAQLGGEPGAALRQAAVAAYVDAMGDALLVAAAVALAGAAVALRFLPGRPRAGEPAAVRPAAPAAPGTGEIAA